MSFVTFILSNIIVTIKTRRLSEVGGRFSRHGEVKNTYYGFLIESYTFLTVVQHELHPGHLFGLFPLSL